MPRKYLMLAALLVYGCGAARASVPTAGTNVPEAGTVTDPGRPHLTMRVFPRMGLAGFSGLVVTFRAELEGREDERFYCPAVVWIWPDETVHSQESDCVPWGEHTEDDYVRSWTMRIRLPAGPSGGWPFMVQLRKSGKVIAQAAAVALVH